MLPRRSSLPLLALLLAACQAPAPPAAGLAPADEAAVRAIVADFVPAAMAKDWDKMLSLYSTDGVRLPPNEPVVERAGLRAWFETYPTMTQFEAPIVHIEGAGDVAAARGTYNLTATVAGQKAPVQDRGKWVSIMKKQSDGSWRIVADIWNSDLPVQK